ncbi:MAG TPA: hypothetical protein VLT82_06330 [Myxococcaceae bacterium]|nr:hypothetical protein [Myxococcaceae bacterium]
MSPRNEEPPEPEKLRPKAYEPGKEPVLSDAERQVVEDLIDANGGRIPAHRQLVAMVRPRESLLHKYFEWDDSLSLVVNSGE